MTENKIVTEAALKLATAIELLEAAMEEVEIAIMNDESDEASQIVDDLGDLMRPAVRNRLLRSLTGMFYY